MRSWKVNATAQAILTSFSWFLRFWVKFCRVAKLQWTDFHFYVLEYNDLRFILKLAFTNFIFDIKKIRRARRIKCARQKATYGRIGSISGNIGLSMASKEILNTTWAEISTWWVRANVNANCYCMSEWKLIFGRVFVRNLITFEGVFIKTDQL